MRFLYPVKTVLDQIILFVSDGRDNTDIGGTPLEVIRDENEVIQNRVVINTYGIGTGRSMIPFKQSV